MSNAIQQATPQAPRSGSPDSATTARRMRPGGNGTGPSAPLATPQKLRRRPALIVLSGLLIAVGAALAAWLATTIGNTHPVVAIRTDVARGDQISREDLLVVSVGTDPALRTVPGQEIDSLVGRYAKRDLGAGGLLTQDSVTDRLVPAADQALVGVALTPAQMPARGVQPGNQVRLVATPRSQDDPPSAAPPTYPAVIVQVQPIGQEGVSVVDLLVPRSQAATIAAVAATGRVALVLDPSRS